MLLLLANVAALIVLLFVILRRGRDTRARGYRLAAGLEIAGLALLALQCAVYLAFGIGETAAGYVSGWIHFAPVIPIVLLGVSAWLRPLEGGISLILCGIAAGASILITIARMPEASVLSAGLFMNSLPQVLAGALFLTAALLARRSTGSLAGQQRL